LIALSLRKTRNVHRSFGFRSRRSLPWLRVRLDGRASLRHTALAACHVTYPILVASCASSLTQLAAQLATRRAGPRRSFSLRVSTYGRIGGSLALNDDDLTSPSWKAARAGAADAARALPGRQIRMPEDLLVSAMQMLDNGYLTDFRWHASAQVSRGTSRPSRLNQYQHEDAGRSDVGEQEFALDRAYLGTRYSPGPGVVGAQ
jgi:hypothetical protein